jgi:hypothetical protein
MTQTDDARPLGPWQAWDRIPRSSRKDRHMTQTDNARGPERIWANIAVWGNGEPLAGEWTYRDVGLTSDIEYTRADLAPDPLRAVKVKPLEWTFWSIGDNAGADAPSIVGLYQIRSRPKEGSHRLFLGSELIAEKDYTELKPIAQADYETRIRSALEPAPLDARVAALVEAAREFDDALDTKGADCGKPRLKMVRALAAFDTTTTGGRKDG